MNPDNTIVTFNGANYDLPLLWHVIKGADNAAAKKASDEIIRERIPRWEVERRLGIRIPQELADRHIDLIEPQPNAFAGLKALNGRLHGNRLQDLPFDPDLRPDERARWTGSRGTAGRATSTRHGTSGTP